MKRPNLKSLYAFDAAARHLNFRLAANELNVTQGAVAQQVRQLEADLGIILFERLARGLALTKDGTSYHKSIHEALEIIERATDELSPSSSKVTLSVTPSLASKWLVPRLMKFAKEFPAIEVNTVASETLANFKTDGIDLAIRQGKPPFGKDLQYLYLSQIELVAISNLSYAETLGPIETIADFTKAQLIEDAHSHWRKMFEKEGIEVKSNSLQLNQTALAMDAVANGDGVALVPRILLQSTIEDGKLKILWEFPKQDPIGFYLVYPSQKKSNSKALTHLAHWLSQQMN
ncbi:LysR substrate-binding domain-containing protein [Curvivirga aplysinae]|uniref:LysR substrate-binding domain-containing protein n=1 Tax=Curvivirga aplysinae TaxID=2529852 RepID=UPI0012BC5483|nr:LysR substrate-binding domain-containing protein [Curvivirga aplysinae]MTI10979.1 LysR family transcriptional regulator [Curvivirga aplysinae]